MFLVVDNNDGDDDIFVVLFSAISMSEVRSIISASDEVDATKVQK